MNKLLITALCGLACGVGATRAITFEDITKDITKTTADQIINYLDPFTRNSQRELADTIAGSITKETICKVHPNVIYTLLKIGDPTLVEQFAYLIDCNNLCKVDPILIQTLIASNLRLADWFYCQISDVVIKEVDVEVVASILLAKAPHHSAVRAGFLELLKRDAKTATRMVNQIVSRESVARVDRRHGEYSPFKNNTMMTMVMELLVAVDPKYASQFASVIPYSMISSCWVSDRNFIKQLIISDIQAARKIAAVILGHDDALQEDLFPIIKELVKADASLLPHFLCKGLGRLGVAVKDNCKKGIKGIYSGIGKLQVRVDLGKRSFKTWAEQFGSLQKRKLDFQKMKEVSFDEFKNKLNATKDILGKKWEGFSGASKAWYSTSILPKVKTMLDYVKKFRK